MEIIDYIITLQTWAKIAAIIGVVVVIVALIFGAPKNKNQTEAAELAQDSTVNLDIQLLRILSAPNRGSYSLDYLIHTSKAHPLSVKQTLEDLRERDLIYIINHEDSDDIDALLNNNGISYLTENNLLE